MSDCITPKLLFDAKNVAHILLVHSGHNILIPVYLHTLCESVTMTVMKQKVGVIGGRQLHLCVQL